MTSYPRIFAPGKHFQELLKMFAAFFILPIMGRLLYVLLVLAVVRLEVFSCQGAMHAVSTSSTATWYNILRIPEMKRSSQPW